MVWEVLGSRKGCGRPMGFVPRERKRPQTIKTIFSWRSTRGGGGEGGVERHWDEEKR
jgi:hypothetical protein